ncbi:hypothetical protein C8Q77DRAFT_1161291 [Trametes polyzona]|nr:hypothetical protein C8Q77DRAFT_1161291 [Trametes polyzona]
MPLPYPLLTLLKPAFWLYSLARLTVSSKDLPSVDNDIAQMLDAWPHLTALSFSSGLEHLQLPETNLRSATRSSRDHDVPCVGHGLKELLLDVGLTPDFETAGHDVLRRHQKEEEPKAMIYGMAVIVDRLFPYLDLPGDLDAYQISLQLWWHVLVYLGTTQAGRVHQRLTETLTPRTVVEVHKAVSGYGVHVIPTDRIVQLYGRGRVCHVKKSSFMRQQPVHEDRP